MLLRSGADVAPRGRYKGDVVSGLKLHVDAIEVAKSFLITTCVVVPNALTSVIICYGADDHLQSSWVVGLVFFFFFDDNLPK